MRKDGKYRFTLQFSADNEDQIRVGELLENLGNRKSTVIISALSDYIDTHPELQSGYSKIEVKVAPAFDRSQMERLIRSIVEEKLSELHGRFLLCFSEGGESDVLIAVIIIVTTNRYFIHSMPSWHVAYIAVKHAVKRYVFFLLWWHAKRRHGNGPQTGLSRTG